MCNNQKLLKQQLKNSKKVKYEMSNFCEQYGLPPITPSRQKGNKKHDKVHKDYKYKRYKRRSTKPATTSIILGLLILIKITSWIQST